MASSSSSSSSSPLAPTFSSQSWNHDVFLSFRGEDTRKNFVDHLYSALVQQGIHTYKDDETLRRGESISLSLMKAIEKSRIVVVVFSENYADSSWCLDELTHIMKCKQTGQIVMPIFYDVDPSQVRKQKEKYGESFVKHELENKNKVEYWRKALVDASNLSGWEPKNIANGHEAKVLKQIVENISSRLHQVTSGVNENLIGIAARVQSLISKLQIGSGGKHMIGIWGVGGGGKTALASCVYDEISIKFDGCCFLENVREESRRHGLGKLKDNVLSKMEANNNGGGRSLINMRFCHRKVLLVLDDVDHLDQLEALAGSPDWFGEGSRVIITTRDEHLLKAHKVVVHDISLLKHDEAIELFRNHAHVDCTSIMGDYELLSKEVVSYAGGLPLALKVLGSSLCDKNIHEWRSALARLKKTPDANILEKLKVSFDGLTKDQKGLFLDIACFFRWHNKDMVVEMLDACGFDPVIGIEELRQKALITISEYERLDMHDLVQEMGHYIVRGEHPNNPEKHSRIWKGEDVLRICAMDATEELDMIEAIRFSRGWYGRSSQVYPPIVANMKNLRWIHWDCDLASPLPNNFQPRELCCLALSGGITQKLWEGYKYLPNLKIMELSSLYNLIVSPNFDGLPNLEKFVLIGSMYLKEIHPSIGNLERLVCLQIIKCWGIKKFPSITRLNTLQTLSFSESPGVFEPSEIQQKMDNLPHNHISLFFFHRELRKLNLNGCKLGDEDMSSTVWELPNLQELNLSRNNFSRLNFGLMRLPRLKWLGMSSCTSLVELLELPSSISVLIVDYCFSLETFGDTSNCKWLWKVTLRGWYNKLRPLVGDMLLMSMLKGNAIEDHCIIFNLPYWKISKVFVDRLFKGNTVTLRLPDDWYNGFCGFFIHLVTLDIVPRIHITIKEEKVDEDPPVQLWHESNEALERVYDGTRTYVGYVSFGWLRRTAFFNSTYNLISFGPSNGFINRIGAALVPRKTKHHHPLPTDSSQYWDDEDHFTKTFMIQHDSNSSIKILWKPE